MILRLLVPIFCILLFGLLALAIADLPQPAAHLPDKVAGAMPASGVEHPVTAVLLNFRGYDTLLEIAVLQVALLGVLACSGGSRASYAWIGGSSPPMLRSLARLQLPLMLLMAGYLLRAGSHQPGGAFQAAAILAASAILLYLAGLLPAWSAPQLWLRTALATGFMLFLAIAAAGLMQGSLLQYPPHWAGMLMLLIEAGLTASLGLLLAGLFLWLPSRKEEGQQ